MSMSACEILNHCLFQYNIAIELRYIVTCFTCEVLSDINIHDAVKLWCKDRAIGKLRYGHISYWDTSRVTNMRNLFSVARRTNFNEDISRWDVSNLTDMSDMFVGADGFNQSINNWNVSKVATMKSLFYCAVKFNQPLDAWDVSNVTDMSHLFHFAERFNQPLNS